VGIEVTRVAKASVVEAEADEVVAAEVEADADLRVVVEENFDVTILSNAPVLIQEKDAPCHRQCHTSMLAIRTSGQKRLQKTGEERDTTGSQFLSHADKLKVHYSRFLKINMADVMLLPGKRPMDDHACSVFL
jgi:hypothetical protein